MQYRHGCTGRRYTPIVRLWHTRIGAPVALIDLAAPAARAGCAARRAAPARPATPRPAPGAAAALLLRI